MNKLIIFDLDGTLIDSLPDIYDCVNLTLAHFNYPLRQKSEIRQFIGNGARNLIKQSFGNIKGKELDEKLAFYNHIYTNGGSPKTCLFDGVDQLLYALKEQGYKLAILTNKPQMTTDKVYEKYLSQFNFDMVVGQSGSVKCKPDPTATLNILQKLNVEKENTIFIGDGETDYLTSKNAGVKNVSVLWGYRDKDQLEKVGASNFANQIKDIFTLINF